MSERRRKTLREGLSERADALKLSPQWVPYFANSAVLKRGKAVTPPERSANLLFVEYGIVAQSIETSNGRHQIISIHYPHDGLVYLYRPAKVRALRTSKVLFADQDKLVQLSSASSAASTSLRRAVEVQMERAFGWMNNLAMKIGEERLAFFLCEQADREFARERIPVVLHLFTQPVMADALALTSVHINRLLSEFEQAGLIKRTGARATILDWHELARLGRYRW